MSAQASTPQTMAERLRLSPVSSATMTEATQARWRALFDSFAVADPREAVQGTQSSPMVLDEHAFLKAVAPATPPGVLPSSVSNPSSPETGSIPLSSYRALFKIADGAQTGFVDWPAFKNFQELLSRPDADYLAAFMYFDRDGSGLVDVDELKQAYNSRLGSSKGFNIDCPWLQLYLGSTKTLAGQRKLDYSNFTQFMKTLPDERLRQQFAYHDRDQDGVIDSETFENIINELHAHKLSKTIKDRLRSISTLTPGGKLSFAECSATHNVIRELDIISRVLDHACAHSADGTASVSDFLDTAQRITHYSLFTPLEANILFHLLGNEKARYKRSEFEPLFNPLWRQPEFADVAKEKKSFFERAVDGLLDFGLGGIAGAFGATMVYPIDLVKTRMQNQRKQVVGQVLYKNSIDCVKKVYAYEGATGFYRGLAPQLVGVAPEKAIKLVVNGKMRDYFTNPETGKIKPALEMVSGGIAGGCQVIVTNPLEVVKIRLQMQGEAAKATGAKPHGAGHIIRSLGLLGLYKGAAACLCRDIPFSAIYFAGYAHLKKDLFQEGQHGKKLGLGETLLAAGIAGMPAAYLTTPADVIKTRLQTEARAGHTPYSGVVDAFRKITAEEGPRALFKGGAARVIRSSPQFGFTLMAYEALQNLVSSKPKSSSGSASAMTADDDITRLRARNALKILLDSGLRPESGS